MGSQLWSTATLQDHTCRRNHLKVSTNFLLFSKLLLVMFPFLVILFMILQESRLEKYKLEGNLINFNTVNIQDFIH